MRTEACDVSTRDARPNAPRLLEDEDVWREMPCRHGLASASGVVVGHWTDGRTARRELTAPLFERHYTVSILLGRATVDCYKDGRLLDRGTGGLGGLQLTGPGEQVTCSFRGANEAIHVFFPDELIEAQYDALHGHGAALRLEDPAFRVDAALAPIAQSLAATQRDSERNVERDERLVLAIQRHVLSRYAHEPARTSSIRGLSPSRLRRVFDYIDANLAEPITLQDIARHSGLSRMHFAAQFRLATGATPHAFLRARRIEHAKQLMMRDMPIIDAALAAGFQGQAHFTTVFRELNGLPPARWLELQRRAAATH